MVEPPSSKAPSMTRSDPPESLSDGSPIRRIPFGRKKRTKVALISLAVGLVLVAWFIPPVYWLLEGPIIVTQYTKKNGETRVLVGPKEKNWTPFQKMSRHFVNAVVAAEDGKFYLHKGLDFEEIRRSYELNKKKNRYARGGSTITQQLVKMAFLGREKTLLRKAREATGALVLEAILPKEKILEWYLNLVELGDGVYGIAAGSQHYFKTKPELLTIEQSVHLALVLPSPNGWSKGLRHQNLTQFGHKRFSSILLRMRQSGTITSSQWMTAISRGNFGKPIHGYASLMAQEEALKKGVGDQNSMFDEDCDQSPECDEFLEDEGLGPKPLQSTQQPPAPPQPPKALETAPSQNPGPGKEESMARESKPALQGPPVPINPTAPSTPTPSLPPSLEAIETTRPPPSPKVRPEEPPHLDPPEQDSF